MDKNGNTKGGLTIAGKKITDCDSDYQDTLKFLTVPKCAQKEAAFNGTDIASIKALESDGLRQIADGMMSAKTSYAFDNISDAQDEFKFRQIAVETMNKMNTGVFDADYFDPIHNIPPRAGRTFLDASAKDPHWNVGEFWYPIGYKTIKGSLHNPSTWQAAFVAQEGVSPAMPIWGQELPFRGECAGALQITINLAAREVLGKERYAEANPSNTIKLGVWHGSNSDNYMEHASLDEPPIYGDYMYLRNDPRYPKLAPNGFWQGLNALYAGKDKLGVDRYSGLGVSWQSAEEIRALMKNAFIGDTGQKADPKEIRLTVRNKLVLHKPQSGAIKSQLGSEHQIGKGHAGLTPQVLKAAGFRHEGEDLYARSDVSLGDLGKALNFSPEHLAQTISAPVRNPAYRVTVDGTPVVVEYHHVDASRQSPETIVSAYAMSN